MFLFFEVKNGLISSFKKELMLNSFEEFFMKEKHFFLVVTILPGSQSDFLAKKLCLNMFESVFNIFLFKNFVKVFLHEDTSGSRLYN